MSTRLFDKGREGIADSINWLTDSFKAIQLQLDGTLTGNAVKAITAATNATPVVITSTAHGYANGDVLVIRGVLGNTAANGTFVASGVTSNTINLTTVADGLSVVGNGAYTSGGCVINLGTIGVNLSDINPARVSSDSAAFTSTTDALGVLNAANVSFAAVTGTVHGVAVYKDTGVASTSRLVFFLDGRTLLTAAADALISATVLWVDKLEGPIASGTAILLSNGVTATLSAPAAAGARSLTVTALSAAVAAGHQGEAQTTGSGLPITLSSGAYTVQWDTGTNKIVKI